MSAGPRRWRVALAATHPIQYQVPWFRTLARHPRIELRVFYALLPDTRQQGVGFDMPFTWDIPMFDGYDWEALENSAAQPNLGGFLASSTPGVGRALAAFRPDVVIITGWHALPLLQALWACMRLGLPRILRGESNAMRLRPWWVRLIHRTLFGFIDGFLAIGRSNRALYLGYGVPQERIFEGVYFVDNERIRAQFEAAHARRDDLRAKWGIPSGAFCLLYAGKLQPKKRILDLMRALSLAYRSNPGLYLLVAGSGELMDEARVFASAEQLPVTFAGFLNQTELPQAYACSQCLVLPSDYGETWGLVVNEAMVCGLPAIVSDRVGCGPDLVDDGSTGRIFPFGDVAALARTMLELAGDPAQAAAMGERARQRVAAYSVEAAAEGTVSAIEYVLAKRRR